MPKKKIGCAIPKTPEIKKFEACVKGEPNPNMGTCVHESGVVREKFEALGYQKLGYGVHRHVFGFDKCAFKVANDGDSRLANKIEWDMWNGAVKTKHPLEEILLPILATTPNHTILVSPKATQGTEEDVAVVRQKLRNVGYSCFDIRPGNVGRVQGKPVLLDYGFGLTCHFLGPPRPPREWEFNRGGGYQENVVSL